MAVMFKKVIVGLVGGPLCGDVAPAILDPERPVLEVEGDDGDSYDYKLETDDLDNNHTALYVGHPYRKES